MKLLGLLLPLSVQPGCLGSPAGFPHEAPVNFTLSLPLLSLLIPIEVLVPAKVVLANSLGHSLVCGRT